MKSKKNKTKSIFWFPIMKDAKIQSKASQQIIGLDLLVLTRKVAHKEILL